MPWLRNAIESALGVPKLQAVYDQVRNNSHDTPSFLAETLKQLGVDLDFDPQDLERIPLKGPVVVVSNHPFGGVEGVMLAYLLMQRRPDVKVLGNPILKHFKEIRSLFYFVEPYQNESAYRSNVKATLNAFRWLKNEGGVLALFPSGEVSHRTWTNPKVMDPQWSDSCVKLIEKSQATAVCVFFRGKNRSVFQAAGLLHPRFRTSLLPSELVNKNGQEIRVEVGGPIYSERMPSNPERALKYLRFRTYALEHRKKLKGQSPAREVPVLGDFNQYDPQSISSEIASLPESQSLCSMKSFVVKYAFIEQIPKLMDHIARMREYTFRLEGEGTGKDRDLDPFDEYYMQLFVWNEEKQELVGAYRMGQIDKIVEERGIEGLYSHQLFHYSPKVLEMMGPSIEMGRSFVTPNYQRNYVSLLLLWKGIGSLICRMPQYRSLFGPVSISSEYSDFSKSLIVDYLKRNHYKEDAAAWVNPPDPWIKRIDLPEYQNLDLSLEEISKIIADVEPRFSGVPILLKHYLRLGGRFYGFNVDPAFNHALDGLIKVNLDETSPKILKSYMGEEGYQFFASKKRPA